MRWEIFIKSRTHNDTFLRVKKCSWSPTAHFPEEIQRGLAASTITIFLPLPWTHLLSLRSVEKRWAGTYSEPGCYHLQGCCPACCPGEWAGLQRSRVCSCLWPCRRTSMKRQMLRDQFISQQMGKNRWEGGEWENRGFGVSHVQHVISPASIVLLLPVCACLLSHSIWSDSEIPMDYSPPSSSVLFLYGGAKCQVPWFSNLTLWSRENTECDSTGGILCNMVTQGASQHLEQHMAMDDQWVGESRSKDK